MMQPLKWLKTRGSAAIVSVARWGRSLRRSGPFYVGSAIVHAAVLWGLIAWRLRVEPVAIEASEPQVDTRVTPEEMAEFELVTPPVRLSELSPKSLAQVESPAQATKRFDGHELFEDAGGGIAAVQDQPSLGGLGGFQLASAKGSGATSSGNGGVGVGIGTSFLAGSGGILDGFNGAGRGQRPTIEGPEVSEETERSVGAALNWLHRHQSEDGSWSMNGYRHRCRDVSCAGDASMESNVTATATGLLALLSAGQTHLNEGPYRHDVGRALEWLVAHELTSSESRIAVPADRQARCLAAFVLCETYRMTADHRLEDALRRILPAIERETPAVLDVWHCLLVDCAAKAGLQIDSSLAARTNEWLRDKADRSIPDVLGAPASKDLLTIVDLDLPPVVAEFSIQPTPLSDQPTTDALADSFLSTLIAHQYPLVAKHFKHDPLSLRRQLLSKQIRTGCATGSWPSETSDNVWSSPHSRLTATCLAACLLAASYRQLPSQQLKSTPLVREPASPVRGSIRR